MDAIHTTDAKKVAEVERGVDVPFAADKIVETAGARLGPSFAAVAKWMPRLAILNAVRQNSANHLSGFANVTRCKSQTTVGTPTLLELLGSRRSHGEALGAIGIGAVMATGFSPEFVGQPGTVSFGGAPGLLDHVDRADPDDLRALALTLRRDAEPLGGHRATAQERTTADNLRAMAAFFDGVAGAPAFHPTPWEGNAQEGYYHNGNDLQRVLWMFEHNLTRCATVCITPQDFDTHLNNEDQVGLTAYLAFLLDRLFTELDQRVVDGKPLSAQTVVIVGSEMGRFPRLNAGRGKDHLPQAPHLFFGPGFAAGSFGATGRDMAALPISLATGKPEAGGHLVRVDDVGTTLLHLEGASPELYGYAGEHLAFLTGG